MNPGQEVRAGSARKTLEIGGNMEAMSAKKTSTTLNVSKKRGRKSTNPQHILNYIDDPNDINSLQYTNNSLPSSSFNANDPKHQQTPYTPYLSSNTSLMTTAPNFQYTQSSYPTCYRCYTQLFTQIT